MTRAEANRCRFEPGTDTGHYESYFLRANHPERALAFWIRYTFFRPVGKPHEAVGEVWAVYFDGEAGTIAAAKEVFPLQECRIGDAGLDLEIGASRLDLAQMRGAATDTAHALAWAMQYTSPQAPMLLLPASLYAAAMPRAKALVAAPSAVFIGSLQLNGKVIDIDGWTGSQNHNWGSRHTDAYAWGQVAGFDGAPEVFLECASARLKVGPFWTPSMSLVVLRIGEQEFSLNGLPQSVRTRARTALFSLEIDARSRDLRITLSMRAARADFAGLAYANPPGGEKACLNTKLAACRLTVEQRGQPGRTYSTRHRAAFEILTDRHDHGVPMLA
ncbi:MAG: hypothetical protein V4631_07590 [Pseudomonadota bacterium]